MYSWLYRNRMKSIDNMRKHILVYKNYIYIYIERERDRETERQTENGNSIKL